MAVTQKVDYQRQSLEEHGVNPDFKLTQSVRSGALCGLHWYCKLYNKLHVHKHLQRAHARLMKKVNLFILR